MIYYTNQQLSSCIALPIVTVILIWTTVIFQKNRKKWEAYDIPIVVILILSILRNITILTYSILIILNQNNIIQIESNCSIIVCLFNSIHTFQASLLTTLAIIGLFSVKLNRKEKHLKQFLTATHIIYHLFCLATLCICVGVAATLAEISLGSENFRLFAAFDSNPCKFMPFDLDIKYNVFIIVLNIFLATVSTISFVSICFYYYRGQPRVSTKPNSDLCAFDYAAANDSNYFDTYTIQRGAQHNIYNGHQNNNVVWNSDLSNIGSTTVSSTNSRKPCIAQQVNNEDVGERRTGLETIHPILIVCYLFYHLPLIVLCIYPQLIVPWPIAAVALWLGLIQDLLIPIGLSIVDSRFCKWVAKVYNCNRTTGKEKLPQVGIVGKFRPFGSQPQSLETSPLRILQSVEHRFPITNGSLYTSIDGRLPVIHNYRRHNKDHRIVERKPSAVMQNVHHHCNTSFHQQQHPLNSYDCANCQTDLCSSHSNLHHLAPKYRDYNQFQQRANFAQSEDTLKFANRNQQFHVINSNNLVIKNSRNLARLNKIRLSKSEQSLNDTNIIVNLPPEQTDIKSTWTHPQEPPIYLSSDDEYTATNNTDTNNRFDTFSSQSSYSITTEANCDFDFYQNDELKSDARKRESSVELHQQQDLKIKRSNSKRSLEHFQIYIDERTNASHLKRSHSFVTLDHKEKSDGRSRLVRSNSSNRRNIGLVDVEYLPKSNGSSGTFVEDVIYFNYPSQIQSSGCNNKVNKKYVGSVPDFKKIFITEYI